MFRVASVQVKQTRINRMTNWQVKCSWKCFSGDKGRPRGSSFWNDIVSGCIEKGAHSTALLFYNRMRFHGVLPDHYMLSFVLRICRIARREERSLRLCKEVHNYVVKSGYEPDLFLATALVEIYSAWFCMLDARKLFDGMRSKDVIAWNVMIYGYVKVHDSESAIALFDRMPERNVSSWNTIISALARQRDLEGAYRVFAKMPKRDAVSYNVLITGYSNVGDLEKARWLFDRAPTRDLVTWNSMIGAYAGNGKLHDALLLFRRMWDENVVPDGFTFTTILSVCARLGALDMGKWVHNYIVSKGVSLNHIIAAALVDMYAKCGRIKSAAEVFEFAPKRHVSVWNAMIGGLAINGCAEDTLEVFELMVNSQIRPDAITFLSILNACAHTGFVDKGRYYFNCMQNEYSIVPQVDHYGAMVDLLGRVGYIDQAYDFICNMNVEPDDVIWRALLSACRNHGNIKLAEYASRQILSLEKRNSGDYVLQSNIYSLASKWDHAQNMWNKMKEKGIPKNPGLSWVEVNGVVYEFTAGDRSNPLAVDIHRSVGEFICRIKMVGFVPASNAVMHDVIEEDKEELLYTHSEKLALAFCMLTCSPRATIRIYKNLRICHDCHSAMKFVSKVYSQKIVVRDRIRFHHFESGICSCKDYW